MISCHWLWPYTLLRHIKKKEKLSLKSALKTDSLAAVILYSWVPPLFSYYSPQGLAKGLSQEFLLCGHSLDADSFYQPGCNFFCPLKIKSETWETLQQRPCKNTKMNMLATADKKVIVWLVWHASSSSVFKHK